MNEEAKIERNITQWANTNGVISYKFSSPGNRGVPDRIFIGPAGKILFLEFKTPGEKPKALQNLVLSTLKLQSCNATWVDNIEEGKQLIRQYCL